MSLASNRVRPAIVVCPGGGYVGCADREGEPVALKFTGLGYHAFVLHYSVSTRTENSAYPAPLYDLARAMFLIRKHAQQWKIDPERVGICGFSAGGHLCASLATHWKDSVLSQKIGADACQFRPNLALLIYPLADYRIQEQFNRNMAAEEEAAMFRISNRSVSGTERPEEKCLAELSPSQFVTEDTPPMFLIHAVNDRTVPAEGSLELALALYRAGVPYELHQFERGSHGFALGTPASAAWTGDIQPDCAAWFALAARWLEKRFALFVGMECPALEIQ